MGTAVKSIIVIALVLCALGIVYVIVSIASGNFSLSGDAPIEKTHSVSDDITSLDIDLEISNVTIKKSDDGFYKVVCHESEKIYHEVMVEDGTLKISTGDNRKRIFRYLFMFNLSLRVEVYLPADSYDSLMVHLSTGNLDVAKDLTFDNIDVKVSTGNINISASATNSIKLKSSTGRISLEDVKAKALDITSTTGRSTLSNVLVEENINGISTTGKVVMSDVRANNLNYSTTTGNIILSDAICTQSMKLDSTTGNIELNKCDAETLDISTSTGNISGTLLTDKSFHAHSGTGKVNVPKTSGGDCDIETSTGNINISISE